MITPPSATEQLGSFKEQVFAKEPVRKFDLGAIKDEVIDKISKMAQEEGQGFVCIVSAAQHFVVIGWARDPDKFLAELQAQPQAGEAVSFSPLAAFVGSQKDADALYQRFAAQETSTPMLRMSAEIERYAQAKRKQEVERRVLLVALQCAWAALWGEGFTKAHRALFAKVKKEKDGLYPDPFYKSAPSSWEEPPCTHFINTSRLPLAVPFEKEELILIAGIALAQVLMPVLRNEEHRGVSLDAVIDVLREWLVTEEDRKEHWDAAEDEYIFVRWGGGDAADYASPYWIVEAPEDLVKKFHAAILAMKFAEEHGQPYDDDEEGTLLEHIAPDGKLYGEVNLMEDDLLDAFFALHMESMTSGNLRDKAEIAKQLAVRDFKLHKMLACCAEFVSPQKVRR